VAAAFAILGILIGAIAETMDLGLPPFVKFVLHEIGEAGKFGLAVLAGVYVLREVMEKQLKDAGKTLGETLGKIATNVDGGLSQLNINVVAGLRELKFDVHLGRSWSPAEADQALRQKIAETVPSRDSAQAQDEKAIGEALLSTDPERWKKAEELLLRLNSQEYYLRLAYKFWSVNRLDEAIQLAEKGLAAAPNAAGITAQLKNSLAYYYAEARRVDRKDQAFALIREAREEVPENIDFLETAGCVRIAFGSREDAIEGVKMCARAAFAKGDDTMLNKWLKRYEERTFA
jgi:tetratricopeptide (TPR) repeat protein